MIALAVGMAWAVDSGVSSDPGTMDPLLVQSYLRNTQISTVGSTAIQVGGGVTLAGLLVRTIYFGTGDLRVLELGNTLTIVGAVGTLGGLTAMDVGSVLATRNLEMLGRRVTVVPGYLSVGFLGMGLVFGGVAIQRDFDILYSVMSGLSLFASYYTGERAWVHQRGVGADLRQMRLAVSPGLMPAFGAGGLGAGGFGDEEAPGADRGDAGLTVDMGSAPLRAGVRPGLYLTGTW